MVATVNGSSDTFDYGLDEAGRWVEEAVNRFVELKEEHFRRGVMEGVTISNGDLKLLPFSDTFSGEEIDADRWRLVYVSTTEQSSVKLRIQRVSGVVKLYYDNGGTWTQMNPTATINNDLYVGLFFHSQNGSPSTSGFTNAVRFDDFAILNSSIDEYAATGTYESAVYDSGRGPSSPSSPTWSKVSWTETLPTGSNVELQLAFSDSPTGPWTYKGPNGSTSAYYTTPGGENITETGGASITKRYGGYPVVGWI